MRRVLVGLVLTISMAGCGTVYHVGDSVVDQDTTPAKGEDRLMLINLDNFRFIEDRKANSTKTAYELAAKDAKARNRLQSTIMTAADKHCAVHKARALATFNNVNLVAGITGAGLS